MSRPARLLAAGIAVAALSVTSGCGGRPASSRSSTPPTASTPSSPSATASASGTPTPALSPTPSASSTSSSSPSSPTVAGCRTSQLRVSLGRADGAAGTIYYPLRLTNTGDAPCETGGYGGVSFVGAAGHQLGAPARRDPSQGGPQLLVLPPGGSAVARLGVAEAGNYDAATCQPVTARGLRVYPPNQTASLFLAHRFQACASSQVQLLSIQPYRSAT